MNPYPKQEPDQYISVYTRQDAIQDGIFKDISEVANQNGIYLPVAITTNLYNKHIKHGTQAIEYYRLQDLLSILHDNLPKFKNDSLITFNFIYGAKDISVEVLAALEAQSPTDPNLAINLLLPEDY